MKAFGSKEKVKSTNVKSLIKKSKGTEGITIFDKEGIHYVLV